MTTAFALAADGRFIDSFCAQPAGFVLAVGAAGLAVLLTIAALTGAKVVPAAVDAMGSLGWWIIAGLILGAWGYKIIVSRGGAV